MSELRMRVVYFVKRVFLVSINGQRYELDSGDIAPDGPLFEAAAAGEFVPLSELEAAKQRIAELEAQLPTGELPTGERVPEVARDDEEGRRGSSWRYGPLIYLTTWHRNQGG